MGNIRLVLVGSAPSSGSTMLADLLDSTPYSLCGPELNLFSVKRIYNIKSVDKFEALQNVSPSLYAIRNRPYIHHMSAYGLDSNILEWLINQASSFREFVDLFVQWYTALRNKDGNKIKIVFEKTPQNINAIDLFLKEYPEGYFVVIVRNPIYVFWSLLRRGFTPFQALFTWLVDNAQWIKHLSNSRVVVLKYEEVVSNPFDSIQALLYKIAGVWYDDRDEFMYIFQNNQHRKWHGRLRSAIINPVWKKSWTETRAGVITNANQRQVPEEIVAMFKSALNFMVNPEYSSYFGLSPKSYWSLIELLGYSDEVTKMISQAPTNVPVFVTKTKDDLKFMIKKALYTLLTEKSGLSVIESIFSPVKRVK